MSTTENNTVTTTTLQEILMNLATKMTTDETKLQKLRDQLTGDVAPEPTRTAPADSGMRELTAEELAEIEAECTSDAFVSHFAAIDEDLKGLRQVLREVGLIPVVDDEGRAAGNELSEALAEAEKAMQRLYGLVDKTGLILSYDDTATAA